MTKTGTLRYGPGEARVDGELLAVANGEPNPLARAKSYLESRGFQDEDRITVTGSEGVAGNTPVFVITRAEAATATPKPRPTKPRIRRRVSCVAVAVLLFGAGNRGPADLYARQRTPAERAIDDRRLAQNGILVGQPKVYDDALLQQMLNDAQARLATLQVIDQAGLIARFGTTAGADLQTSAFAVNVQGTAMPQTGTTIKPPAAAVTAPSATFPSSFSVSAPDLLTEQMQLTFEIANLRLLLEGALSDRLFQNPAMKKIKPRTTIGVPITIESDRRHKNAVAVVEVEIERLATLDPDEQPAVTAVLPRDKTYNVAEITDSSMSIGGGVVTQLVGIGGSWLRGHKTYYLAQDQDTLGLTFKPARANAVGVGWQFRPVLGREYVRGGLKQTFAQLSFPSAISEPYYGRARIRTYWRQYDRKRGILGDIVGGSLNDAVVDWKIPRFPLEIPPGDFTPATLTDLGGAQMLVNVPGPFLAGTHLRVGQTVYQPGSVNATFELNRIRIVAPITELATKGAVLVARDGQEVPLVLHRTNDPAGPELTVPPMSATVTALDAARSRLTVRFAEPIDTLEPQPVLLVGGRVYGYMDAPIERTADTMRAVVPTAVIAADPTVVVTALFAPNGYARRAVAEDAKSPKPPVR